MRAGQTCFQALWYKATHFSSHHHLTGGKDLTAKEKTDAWDFLGQTSKHSHSHPEDANNSMEMVILACYPTAGEFLLSPSEEVQLVIGDISRAG